VRRPLLVALVLVAVFALGAGVGWLVFPPDDESSTTLSAADTAPAPAPVASVASSSTTTTTTTTIIPPKPRRGTMAFTGDLLPHGPVVNAAAANAAAGWDFLPMFAEVAPIISAADVAICHLETPLSLDDTDISGYPVFNAPRALAEAARDAGYDGCSTASNHSYDRGASGVESTVQVMDEVGLAQAGMAVSEAGDLTPLFYDVNGISVAHISATYGLNGFELPADRPYMVDLIDPAAVVEQHCLVGAHRQAGAQLLLAVAAAYRHDRDRTGAQRLLGEDRLGDRELVVGVEQEFDAGGVDRLAVGADLDLGVGRGDALDANYDVHCGSAWVENELGGRRQNAAKRANQCRNRRFAFKTGPSDRARGRPRIGLGGGRAGVCGY
jgi:hypothetical protein